VAKAGAATLGDSAAAMSVGEAARMAALLFRSRRAYESLPFYRRVAPQIPPTVWEFHLEFATALQTASLETRGGGPRASAPTRASDERVALMLESLSELARAEQAAPLPRDRARVMVSRAFFLRVWGFPLDALAELHRALAIDPSYPDLGPIAELMARWLRDPTISTQAMELAERKARSRTQPGPRR